MKHYFLLTLFLLTTSLNIHADYDRDILMFLLKQVKNPPVEKYANYGIYRKGDILFCEGNSVLAETSNAAAEMILDGKYSEAVKLIEDSLVHAPLFLPFRYNLGIAYYFISDYDKSLLNLNKAALIVPDYYMIYTQIGHAKALSGKLEDAAREYRKALRLNPEYLDGYIFTGDIYLSQNRISMAERYYNRAIEIDPFFNNARIGKAKILFVKESYYKAYQEFLLIDTKTDYDKSLHYYLAECAYKLQDYEIAYLNYEKLLEFRNSRFFLTISLSLIQHKRDLSRKFYEQIKEGIE
ncbi:MAG: tetratricopeptide repeat protein [Spirochaetes bacterium]|nr:tetratricopeptide repeat protein [Spirochaetota bacterium]